MGAIGGVTGCKGGEHANAEMHEHMERTIVLPS